MTDSELVWIGEEQTELRIQEACTIGWNETYGPKKFFFLDQFSKYKKILQSLDVVKR